jgi:hypothetical protein
VALCSAASRGRSGHRIPRLTACPYASVVQQLERNYFKKQGIPMVALEGTVHNEPPTEEQVMKVKTFIDMLS